MRVWRRRSGLHLVLSVMALVGQVACSSWRTQQVAPADLLNKQSPHRIRLTLNDRTRLEVHSPTLRNDSLVGLSKTPGIARSEGTPFQSDRRDIPAPKADTVAVALADIQTVAVRKGDPLKSVGLAIGILGGVALMAAAACANDCYTIDLGGTGGSGY